MSTKKRCKVRGKFQARHDPEKMRIEEERIKTFKTWSKKCPIGPGPLAKAGFYYVGIFDRVKCFACGGQIEGWEEGETAMGEHEREYPHCDMVKNMDKKNITIEMWNEMKKSAGTEHVDGQVVLNINNTFNLMTSDDYVKAYCGTSLTGKFTCAINPLLADESRRLDTFREWPHDSKISASDTIWLANAGFYYTGPRDRTRCFNCEGGIEFWEEDDEPWCEHARNFPTCEWLIAMKGKAFVDEVQNEKASEEAEERKLKDSSTASTQSSDRQKTPVSEAGESQKDTKVSAEKLVDMIGSPTVKMIISTGFDAGLVCRMLEAQLRETNLNFSSSDNFIKALELAKKRDDSADGKSVESGNSNSTDTQTERFANLEITGDQRQEDSQQLSPSPESPSLQILRNTIEKSSVTASPTGYPPVKGPERLVCRECNYQDVSSALFPCNHEVTCFQCARVTIKCPLCATPVKTYRRISDIL